MGHRTRAIATCIVLMLALGNRQPSHAQQAQSSYQVMSDKFFNLLQQSKASDAVDYMFSTNPTLQNMTDEHEQLKAQFTSLGNLAGHYVSHTLLAETTVGGMFVYQHYFVAYERQPVSVRIKYYKPRSTWVCYGLEFDTKLTDHIQDAVDARVPLDVK